MMIIRVLPIHVPTCYEGAYLKPLHWNHIWLMMIIWSDPSMFHDAVSPWSLHIYHYEAMQGQGPHFPPTRKATSHIHRGEGGKGVKMGTLHWGGVGGGLAKPGSYIYIYISLQNGWFISWFQTLFPNGWFGGAIIFGNTQIWYGFIMNFRRFDALHWVSSSDPQKPLSYYSTILI